MIKKVLCVVLFFSFCMQAHNFADLPYDQVGKTYDATRCADPEIVEGFITYMQMEQGKKYVDISCGSGNYTVALHKKGYAIIGLDISPEMLKKARAKDPFITLLQGDAHQLPFEDNSFDGVFCIHAMHHYRDVDTVFKEMYRVLAPGGKLLIFTTFVEQCQAAWIGHYFPHIWQLSKDTLKTEYDLLHALQNVGFQTINSEKYFVSKETKDLTIYGGKYKPEIYLDPIVRAGMTPFNFPQYKDLVDAGLERLRADIESGEINAIIERYESGLGEHVYVIATKV